MTILTSIDTPLCPMSLGFDTGPQASLHRFKNLLLDEFLKHLQLDENGEPIGEVSTELNNIFHEVNYQSRFSDYMQLFRHTNTPEHMLGTGEFIETYYYQCLVCGFTLPAYRSRK